MGLEDHTPSPPDDAEAAALRERVARRVRELRQRSGRSLADLATAAGIGKSTLHAIEAGDANPGIETLWSLAQALGVAFGDLLEPATPQVRVVRAADAPRVGAEDASMQARLLASTRGGRIEVFTLELFTRHEHQAHAHSRGTVEHVLVTAGRLRVGPSHGEVELEAGDLVTFPGDVDHLYEALEDPTSAVLLIEYP